ncbi:MAG: Transcriptional regulator of heat shock protein [candidate division Kazan bacterium GW2011_GWA1_44_22]|uniref:Transcriptional regulator of heat shock protein n=1 Tax=candidate division Kazan bacterium GW2011_GWA1_44_22 TaxID=1620410 RepID=A0A0G1HYP2_UNCK3|nr:MAG: Transcriptional regulator of heat shock protein [candidate division Kazan bacterium GW2011_GWA1_44_22]
MDSNARKQDILKVVIETFVHTGQPVGSMQVAEQLPYETSSATVRNDMVELTELGLLSQPHTSAGRVPTDLGGERKELSKRQQEVLSRHFEKLRNLQERYQAAAQMLAEMSGNVGLLMDDMQNVYLSGLSNVVRLPEFNDDQFGLKLVEALEQPKQLIKDMAQNPKSDDVNVLIGEENPHMRKATIVISNFGPGGKRVISIIGPTRMDYNKNLPLVEYMKKLLTDL